MPGNIFALYDILQVGGCCACHCVALLGIVLVIVWWCFGQQTCAETGTVSYVTGTINRLQVARIEF